MKANETKPIACLSAVDGVLLEAVGGLLRGARGDLQRFAQEDVLEGVLRTGRAVTVEQVDRSGDLGARDFAPVADPPGEDAFDVSWERFEIGLALFVMMQTPSRAIL